MKQTYKGIDLIKLFAAIGVVAVHVKPPFFRTIGKLSVPFFLIVSSFFFFQKYMKLEQEKTEYLKSYIIRILKLYCIWQCFYLPEAIMNFFKYMKEYDWSIKGILIYLVKFVTATGGANGWVQSWYLIALIMGLIFFILIMRLTRNNLVLLGIFCISIEIIFIMNTGYHFITGIPTHFQLTFPRTLIYIYSGMLCAINKEKLRQLNFNKIFFVFLFFICLFYLENLFIHNNGGLIDSEEIITTLPTSVLLFLVAVNIVKDFEHNLMYRNFSTFLYSIHIFFVKILEYYITGINSTNFGRIAEWLIVIFLSFLTFILWEKLRKYPKLKFLNYCV